VFSPLPFLNGLTKEDKRELISETDVDQVAVGLPRPSRYNMYIHYSYEIKHLGQCVFFGGV
jgi:hypothetical protein